MDTMEANERPEGVEGSDFVQEMRRSYLDYAMSVIVSRALPDVRDGLKPVHRRILYGMHREFAAGKPYKKSARIVGDVMGKYHPHGDGAIYDAYVRMAQTWKMRHVMVDGQGNYGSVDGDPPAAMRYTEGRMTRLAMEMVADIGKRTVPFGPNYDEKEEEPLVLPSRFPNLLVNGGVGIAVGMATTIPTHNLREVIDAALMVMSNPEATVEDILTVMPGPDFPTRGVIQGIAGIKQAYATGRGSIVVSGVANIASMSRGRSQIVISELPYDVNKEKFVKDVAEFVSSVAKAAKEKDKKNISEAEVERGRVFAGISEIRDESDLEEPIRVVIDVKADADAHLVLAGLKRFTALQSSFSCNMTCLSGEGKPEVMGVQQMLREWVSFRRLCVRRRTSFDLDNARDAQVKQIGLYAASNDIDEVVRIIRTSSSPDAARVSLMAYDFAASEELKGFIVEADPDLEPSDVFRLNEVQADTILELPLRSLTSLERDKIANRLRDLAAEIRGLLGIMNEPGRLDEIIREELLKIRETFGDDRLTRIERTEADEIDDESLIERRDVVVSLTRGGYVKRTELSSYRSQRRGGKGRNGMETKDDDFVISSISCTTKTPLLVFTARGMVYSLKAYRLPDAAANAKGRYIGNIIDVAGDRVISLMPLPEERAEVEDKNLVFVTSFGTVRRNSAKDFLDINRRGKIAMKLDEDASEGSLVAVLIAEEHDDVLVATSSGTAIRFPVTDVRVFQGRDSTGVRAVTLKDRDRVVDAVILDHVEVHRFERDAYLAGGMCYYRERADLLNDRGERVDVPPTVALKPVPEEGREDRFEAVLDAGRYLEIKARERFLLTVTANGFGKRSSTLEYRVTSRGGVGVRGATINDTTGPLVACLLADDNDGLVLITDGGQTIRTTAVDISVHGRDARGVRLLSVPDGQRIAAVAKVPAEDTEEEAVAAAVEGLSDEREPYGTPGEGGRPRPAPGTGRSRQRRRGRGTGHGDRRLRGGAGGDEGRGKVAARRRAGPVRDRIRVRRARRHPFRPGRGPPGARQPRRGAARDAPVARARHAGRRAGTRHRGRQGSRARRRRGGPEGRRAGARGRQGSRACRRGDSARRRCPGDAGRRAGTRGTRAGRRRGRVEGRRARRRGNRAGGGAPADGPLPPGCRGGFLRRGGGGCSRRGRGRPRTGCLAGRGSRGRAGRRGRGGPRRGVPRRGGSGRGTRGTRHCRGTPGRGREGGRRRCRAGERHRRVVRARGRDRPARRGRLVRRGYRPRRQGSGAGAGPAAPGGNSAAARAPCQAQGPVGARPRGGPGPRRKGRARPRRGSPRRLRQGRPRRPRPGTRRRGQRRRRVRRGRIRGRRGVPRRKAGARPGGGPRLPPPSPPGLRLPPQNLVVRTGGAVSLAGGGAARARGTGDGARATGA